MAINHRSASDSLRELLALHSAEELLEKLAPKQHEAPPRVSSGNAVEAEDLDRRWEVLPNSNGARAVLLDTQTSAAAAAYAHNIENFVGTVKIPVGIAGPVRVNGTFAQGDYYVPLATTEAALVASYNRGACLITEAGGCSAVTMHQGVARAPGFAFASLHEAGQFVAWAVGALDEMRRVAEATSRFARLKDMRVSLDGNHVYLIFEYATGDAAGQNMVTIATQAICEMIAERSPVKAQYAFVEANHSGDKKASALSFVRVR